MGSPFRDVYGRGFYSTYDIESQEQEGMKDRYGNLIIKFAVPITNFLIGDKEEYVKSPMYNRIPHIKSIDDLTEDDLLSLDRFADQDLNYICSTYGHIYEQIKYYQIDVSIYSFFYFVKDGNLWTSDIIMDIYSIDHKLSYKVD